MEVAVIQGNADHVDAVAALCRKFGLGVTRLKCENRTDCVAAAHAAWSTRRDGDPQSGTKAAKKAWVTRRAKDPQSGTKAAKKAWKTRRKNKK